MEQHLETLITQQELKIFYTLSLVNVASLNGTQITQATELYYYRAYLETLLTYGSDAAESHLKNALWHLDTDNMKGGDCTKPNETNNDGFIRRWNRMKKARQ